MAGHLDTITNLYAAFARGDVWKFSGDRAVSFIQHTDTVLVQRALQ